MNKEELYDMQLHEIKEIDGPLSHTSILRVVDGWIYYKHGKEGVFVPEANSVKHNIVDDIIESDDKSLSCSFPDFKM